MWAEFVAANLERLQSAGLPPLATRSAEHWDDLLRHGRFEHHEDPAHFEMSRLTDGQYTVLVDLVESYFLAGYEYFTPGAPLALQCPRGEDPSAGLRKGRLPAVNRRVLR